MGTEDDTFDRLRRMTFEEAMKHWDKLFFDFNDSQSRCKAFKEITGWSISDFGKESERRRRNDSR